VHLVDGAYLLHQFTTPIGNRSTFFYEIVQRVNHYDGFGLNNIEALFKAMELELNQKLN
jgi:4-hydroxyphenylpyruvate dioxygenase